MDIIPKCVNMPFFVDEPDTIIMDCRNVKYYADGKIEVINMSDNKEEFHEKNSRVEIIAPEKSVKKITNRYKTTIINNSLDINTFSVCLKKVLYYEGTEFLDTNYYNECKSNNVKNAHYYNFNIPFQLKIFYKKYRDIFTEKIDLAINMFEIKEGYIVNKYKICPNNNIKTGKTTSVTLNRKTHIMNIPDYNHNNICLIFNYEENNGEAYADAINMLKTYMPHELVYIIVPYLGCNKIKQIYTKDDFVSPDCPSYSRMYKTIYPEKIPNIISKDQIIELYKNGFIKFGCCLKYPTNSTCYYLLTADTYFCTNGLREEFATLKAMKQYIANLEKHYF